MIVDFIYKYIEEKGIRQTVVAKNIGLSKQNLNSILHGKTPLTLENYVLICEFLGVPFEKFIEESKKAGDRAEITA